MNSTPQKRWEVRDRLPTDKNCVHQYRFLKTLLDYDCFYCEKCLLYVFKFPDFDEKKMEGFLKENSVNKLKEVKQNE